MLMVGVVFWEPNQANRSRSVNETNGKCSDGNRPKRRDTGASSKVTLENGQNGYVIDEHESGVGILIKDVIDLREDQEIRLMFRGQHLHAIVSAITLLSNQQYRLSVQWTDRK